MRWALASTLAVAGWPEQLETFSVPGEIELHETLALHLTVKFAPPQPPLHAGAGLLAIEGRHPTDPWRRMRLELLAAGRGPEQVSP